MGLKVNIEHSAGAIITYVNLANITLDKVNKTFSAAVCGFLSKEFRNAGKAPQAVENMVFTNRKTAERKIVAELDEKGNELKDEAGNVITTSKVVETSQNDFDDIYADIAEHGLEGAIYNHLKTEPDFEGAEND